MDGYCGIQNTAHRIEQSLRVPLVESRQPRAWVKTSLIQVFRGPRHHPVKHIMIDLET